MKNKLRILAIIIGIFSTCLLLNVSESSAAGYPAYTIKKGSSKSISSIVKNNPLTKSKANSTYKKLTWKSKNSAIVKVVKSKIKGKKKGTTYICGYREKKKVLSIKVTVGTPVSKLKVSASSLTLMSDETHKLTFSVTPSKASNKKVFYRSSNTKILTVSTSGKITPVKGGSAKVYVTTKDGHKKKTVSVKVLARTVRMTTYGLVKGKNLSKSLVWYGIPYGADTSGANRWRAPQIPASWTGTKSVTTKKPGAAQYGDGESTYTGTEDCLYVNVFRPDSQSDNLPVMVYLHGGGNATSNCNRNFSYLAESTNTVIVAVEYRLGAFGFLSHPALRDGTAEENSGNFTMLDIRKSLQWVQSNISYFGGNKSNVTLAGYSAGARDVMFCMISPIMKGLFHKAITFSGGAKTCTNKQGETSVDNKLAAILVKRGSFTTTKNALTYIQENATNEELRKLFNSLSTSEVANMYNSPSLRLGSFPQGFNDGIVISVDGFDAIPKGNYNRVPIILGSNTTEFSTFAWNSRYVVDPMEQPYIGLDTMGLLEQTIKYGSLLQTYHYIEEPAKLFASDAAHKSVYAYRFNWGTNPAVTGDSYSRFVGAIHGLDVNFLLGFYPNNYQQIAPNAVSSANEKGRLALTNTMRMYIKNFMKNGNPNGDGLNSWNTWGENELVKVMMFDANNTTDLTAMSTSYYTQDDIFDQIRAGVSKGTYETMFENSLKGRFFVPEIIPKYEKNN